MGGMDSARLRITRTVTPGRNGHSPDHLIRELFADPSEHHSRSDSLRPRTAAQVDAGNLLLDDEPAMLGFLETMNDFLRTQREVIEAYLRGRHDAVDDATGGERHAGLGPE